MALAVNRAGRVELEARDGTTTALVFDAAGSTLFSAVDTRWISPGGGLIRNGVHAIQRWRSDTAYPPDQPRD